MKIFFVILNPEKGDSRDHYHFLIEEKLKLAALFIKENLYSYRNKHAVIFAPINNDPLGRFDHKWRSWTEILSRTMQLPLVFVGQQFSLASILKKEFEGIASVIAENISSVQNVVLPLPSGCITECLSAIKWKLHAEGPWKEIYDVPSLLEMRLDRVNGIVLMIDTSYDASHALRVYADHFLINVKIPDYFFPSGYSSPTKNGRNTLKEMQRFLQMYLTAKRGLSEAKLGDPTAKFGHMLRDARNGMGKLPVTYSVKEKAVNA